MDYYEILGVSENAPDEVIRAARNALAKKYHPDVFAGDSNTAEYKMKQLNEAYSVLSDPLKRKAYNESLKRAQQQYSPPKSHPPESTSRKSTSKKSQYDRPFPNSGVSFFIICLCLFLALSHVLHPYIENIGLGKDIAFACTLFDLSIISLVLMLVPLWIGSSKKEFDLKGINRLCITNSIIVLVISLFLYVTEVMDSMFVN